MDHKIVCLSDTHGQHIAKKLKIPNGDFLIYAGDFTASNGLLEIHGFLHWLDKLPHRHKIIVAGNHDFIFCNDNLINSILAQYSNIHWLERKHIEIDGIKFYGTAIQPQFMNWGFNEPPEKRKIIYGQIPNDIDILITHCPPHGILDQCPNGNVGCPILKDEVINRIKPKYHIFGHIHESYKTQQIGDITFINCSVLDGQYRLKNKPIIFTYKK